MTTITPKKYHAQLPLRNYRIVGPVPPPRPPEPAPLPPSLDDLSARLANLSRFAQKTNSLAMTGFWFCRDCRQDCEREEGEHGQPAHCARCGSHRIHFVEPIKEGQ